MHESTELTVCYAKVCYGMIIRMGIFEIVCYGMRFQCYALRFKFYTTVFVVKILLKLAVVQGHALHKMNWNCTCDVITFQLYSHGLGVLNIRYSFKINSYITSLFKLNLITILTWIFQAPSTFRDFKCSFCFTR